MQLVLVHDNFFRFASGHCDGAAISLNPNDIQEGWEAAFLSACDIAGCYPYTDGGGVWSPTHFHAVLHEQLTLCRLAPRLRRLEFLYPFTNPEGHPDADADWVSDTLIKVLNSLNKMRCRCVAVTSFGVIPNVQRALRTWANNQEENHIRRIYFVLPSHPWADVGPAESAQEPTADLDKFEDYKGFPPQLRQQMLRASQRGGRGGLKPLFSEYLLGYHLLGQDAYEQAEDAVLFRKGQERTVPTLIGSSEILCSGSAWMNGPSLGWPEFWKLRTSSKGTSPHGWRMDDATWRCVAGLLTSANCFNRLFFWFSPHWPAIFSAFWLSSDPLSATRSGSVLLGCRMIIRPIP